MLTPRTQFVGDHETLAASIAENRGKSIDLMKGQGDALLVRGSVLEHGDVNIQRNQFLTVNINPCEADSGQLVTDICVENALTVFFSKSIQALPISFLRGNVAVRNLSAP